jgi:hypothetical protein
MSSWGEPDGGHGDVERSMTVMTVAPAPPIWTMLPRTDGTGPVTVMNKLVGGTVGSS